ncbi:unnamed protein product [Paramecium primaurelia]|uniref:RING-type domain-containing protein n=1 Tax=Paramecium primaurelia TaxID=5886 RepID=A0A8S1M989_PARPR|nr:unnamed protein product [Paramecium primaurelia]
MTEENHNFGDAQDDEDASFNNSSRIQYEVNEEFRKVSENKLQVTKVNEENNVCTIKLSRTKSAEKQQDHMMILLLSLLDRELYIKQVSFKVDSWKVYAESEKLTQLVKQSQHTSTLELIKSIVPEVCNIVLSFEIPANSGKKSDKQEFGRAHTHTQPIPYQGFSTCCWSPQGHLITVHNTATSHQKQAKDQKAQYTTLQELNSFVFSQPKKKQSNQQQRHVVEIREDEENLQPFFQAGIQLISEKEDEAYDYLNFQFYYHYFPQFHQQEVPKEQKVEKVSFYKDYEIYDLHNNPDVIILGEQFKNLSKKVYEQQDKKTVINQNVEISIYDFGSYSFHVDNITSLHEYFTSHMKKNNNNTNINNPLKILFQPLEEYFKLYNSSIANFVLTSGVTLDLQEYNMKILKILSDCIYQQQLKKVQHQEMNLIKDFQEYFKKLWNSQYQIYRLYDQIAYSIKKSNLKDTKKLLDCVYQLKLESNIEMKDQIKDLIKDEISKYNSQPNPKLFVKGTQIISTYDNFQKIQNECPIYIIWNQLNNFPLIVSDKVEFSKLNVLKTALRAQSPINFCIYKKLKSTSFQVGNFRDLLNNEIYGQGPLQLGNVKQNQNKTICSICQQIITSHGLFCSSCQHGGHYEHMLQWKQTCPVCDCDCRK